MLLHYGTLKCILREADSHARARAHTDDSRAQHVSSEVKISIPVCRPGIARMCHRGESLQVFPSLTLHPPPSPRRHFASLSTQTHMPARRQVTLGICSRPRHNLRVIRNHLSDGILSGPTQGQYHRRPAKRRPAPQSCQTRLSAAIPPSPLEIIKHRFTLDMKYVPIFFAMTSPARQICLAESVNQSVIKRDLL